MKINNIKQEENKEKTLNNAQNLHDTAKKSEFNVFWKVEKGRIEIIISDILKILLDAGFVRFDIDNGYTFVRISNNKIKEVAIKDIKDFFFDNLKQYPDDLKGISKNDLIEKLYKGVETYFSRNILERLTIDKLPNFIQDTKDNSVLFFKNTCVSVSKEGIKLIPYNEIEGYIWENQIIQRNFQDLYFYNKNIIDICQNSVFAQFTYLICNSDEEKFLSLSSIVGYLLHSYDTVIRKAVCFTDSSLEDSNNGRSGKTLLAKGLGKIKGYTEVAGKDFRADNKHKYQTCKLDTQILHLNDLKGNFYFETLYNDITEGISVERKNQTPFIIRPKIILSTNKPLRIEGGSDKDRIIEFEFSSYFNYKYRPQDEFKHLFFDDWNINEWNSFDNFLLWCLQTFLQKGILQPENKNLALRKLKQDTSPDFLEWAEDVLNPLLDDALNGKESPKFCNPELFNNFIAKYNYNYNESQKDTEKRKFNKSLKYYLDFRGIKLKDEKYNETINYKGKSEKGFTIIPFNPSPPLSLYNL